jgi:multicomponent K+:H+ antiporter subunit G
MTGIALLLEALASLLVLAGAFFTLAGSIGLARFPDFFLRLHGPTKATTLGVGSLLIASALHFSSQGAQIRFQEVLIMLFLFITAPVSATLMAKSALHLRVACPPGLPSKRLDGPGWTNAARDVERRHQGGEPLEPGGSDRGSRSARGRDPTEDT